VPSPKISILDAIGFAGDLTIYGRRDNILLIRSDSNNQKKFIRLNLNSSDIFTSPYFYLKQNDVVYVQTNKAKVVGSDVISSRFLTYLSIALTLILAISGRIK
jgi:polysaccharide export outer membrane protein